MAKYIMALDAGTTSNRCILFNEKGEICSMAQKEFTQYFPKPGWVEHDANEIWSSQLGVAVEAMLKIGAAAQDIAAIGITNQRETTIVWDKVTGWGMDGKITYALEGSIFVAGAAVQWLRDEMKLINSAADSEYMAKKVPDTNGCYVVPAFTGLGAPHWDQYARGTIVGITRGVNKYHIIRATLESIAYQTNDVLQAMKADSGIDINILKVDGGASANDFLMQTQADILGVPVNRPVCVETTAMGAAYLAGLAVGYWKDKGEVVKNWAIDQIFEARIASEEREKRIRGWNKAVRYAFDWIKEEND